MKSFAAASLFSLISASTVLAGDGPFAASPGQCFGRVALPPRLESREVWAPDAPGGMERRLLPPRVERRLERVLVRPARVERVEVPAVYRTSFAIVTEPGPRRWVRTPAQVAVRTERRLAEPGRWVWERRFGQVVSGPPQPGQTVVSPTGLILCKVWCPARFETVERRVLVAPARAYSVPTVVRHRTASRVLVRPARLLERRVPAEYRQVAVVRTLAPARVRLVRTPPRFHMVEDRRVVAGGQGWAPVVCSGPLSPPALQHMQAALAARGYDPGPADGAERPQTYAALRRFQADHAMAAGQVTVESARALEIIP